MIAGKKNKTRGKRFLILMDAAKALNVDMGMLSRKVSGNKIDARTEQIYINAGTQEKPDFYPITGRTIRVIDMDKIKTTKVVKFRRK